MRFDERRGAHAVGQTREAIERQKRAGEIRRMKSRRSLATNDCTGSLFDRTVSATRALKKTTVCVARVIIATTVCTIRIILGLTGTPPMDQRIRARRVVQRQLISMIALDTFRSEPRVACQGYLFSAQNHVT
jgi:hypothetical protein